MRLSRSRSAPIDIPTNTPPTNAAEPIHKTRLIIPITYCNPFKSRGTGLADQPAPRARLLPPQPGSKAGSEASTCLIVLTLTSSASPAFQPGLQPATSARTSLPTSPVVLGAGLACR